MIKAVIFDFGNVICSVDRTPFLNTLAKFSDKPISEIKNTIYGSDPLRYHSTLLADCESGRISSEEFYRKIKKILNLSMAKKEFMKAHTSIFALIRTTQNLIRKLKPNYKLALLSNCDKWVLEYNIKRLEIFDLLDAVSASFQVKEMKPGKKIFLDALRKLKVRPEECIYIDDIKEFVDVASQLGMHGVQYTSHKKLIDSLRKLNVKI